MKRSLAAIMLGAALGAGGIFAAAASVPVAVGGQAGAIPTLAPILKQVTPGVVNIAIRGRIAQQMNPLFNDPFFRRFFPEGPPERAIRAAGSGVVIDAREGLIITNNHVIEYADEITVSLADGRRMQAKRVGGDPETDVALIKVQADNLTAIPLGDSDKLEVGDFVLAIGNPFQIGQTVTSGIVSGLRRNPGIDQYEDFIQTDASINPGNSGGALINLRGELVGINTAIVGASGANVGIGFAIPINMARGVADQISKSGEIRRGQLGVMIQDVTADIIREHKLPAQQTGAFVARIVPGSAAERADLKAGDVITAVDQTPVRGASDLRNKLALRQVGDVAELTVLREGRSTAVRATLAEREPQPRPR